MPLRSEPRHCLQTLGHLQCFPPREEAGNILYSGLRGCAFGAFASCWNREECSCMWTLLVLHLGKESLVLLRTEALCTRTGFLQFVFTSSGTNLRQSLAERAKTALRSNWATAITKLMSESNPVESQLHRVSYALSETASCAPIISNS